MSYKHGVYNAEQATSLTTPIQGTAGLQVIFGSAPIHLSKTPTAAANDPKLCYSFAECAAAMGYSDDFRRFTICQAIDASFRVFSVAPVVLINVLDPSKPAHRTENAAADYPVEDGLLRYDVPFVLLHTLEVKNADTVLAADIDYLAAHDETGAVIITPLPSAGAPDLLTVSSVSINPDGVTAEDIVGGVDALTGRETGLELVRQVYPRFGMPPGMLLAPGWSQEPVVAAALQTKSEAVNGVFACNCCLDIAADEDGAVVYTAVKAAKEKMGAGSNHAAALWPMVAVGEKVYYYSAVFAALTANTDAHNGDVP